MTIVFNKLHWWVAALPHPEEVTLPDPQQSLRFEEGAGFIAALDQSGGSTPKALRDYGIDPSAYSSEAEMFELIHQARARIITSPVFTSDRVLGAILFEGTLDRPIGGKDGLTATQSDEAFNETLYASVESIYQASVA